MGSQDTSLLMWLQTCCWPCPSHMSCSWSSLSPMRTCQGRRARTLAWHKLPESILRGTRRTHLLPGETSLAHILRTR